MDERDRNTLYEFGPFRVDMAKRVLSRDGSPLPITSKAFDTLAILLADPGETVSKAALMNGVWAETAVEENNLTQQISTLRRALGERARDHRYIVTVPGRGYRFVAEVTELPAEMLVEAAASRAEIPLHAVAARRWDRHSIFGGGLAIGYVIAVCLAVLFAGGGGGDPQFKPHSVAVLSFRTSGADEDRLGIGIRDTLRAKLGSLDDITVRPGTAEPSDSDALEAGRRMHADVVLAGSIQRDDDRIRVAVELVDVSGERIVWGKTFDERPANLFELQDAIAREVMRALRVARSPGARLGLPTDRPRGAAAVGGPPLAALS